MRCRLATVAVLGTTALLSTPDGAAAWGSAGHRAIGEIASHYLTPRARLEVERLLEPGPYETLAAAGYWADAHARLYRAYDEYLRRHYVDVDPGADRIVLERDCPEDCILTAIDSLTGSLRQGEPPLWLRAQDFRFLVHFVEDLHQPLHVGHPDGRGGNLTDVLLFEEETDLHSAWDWGLIERRLEAFEEDGTLAADEVPAWQEWAHELRLEITPDEVESWSAPLDPLVWAHESLESARRLTFDVASGERLDEAYYAAALPLIEQRIKMAGVRLAALLNDIFDRDPAGQSR
jgi:hypothetical protein